MLLGPDIGMGRGASAERSSIHKASTRIFWVCKAFSNSQLLITEKQLLAGAKGVFFLAHL